MIFYARYAFSSPSILDHGFSGVFSMNGGRDCGDEDDTASCGNTMMVRKMKIKMNINMNTIMKTVIDGDDGYDGYDGFDDDDD
jgi:hypothetical protein